MYFQKPDYGTALANFFTLLANEPGMSAWRELLVDDWRRQIDEATFKGFLRFASLPDERYLLPGVNVPTLAIAAENDVIRVDRIRHMVAQIPGAQFALIKRASHMAPFSAIETFREIVTTFIRTGTLPREVWEP